MDFPRLKCMLALIHVDTTAAEAYSFQLKPCSLFARSRSPEFYFPACAQHSMPRKLICWIGSQQPGHGAVKLRIPGGSSYSTVSADLARRDGDDHATKYNVAWLIRTHRSMEDVPSAFLYGALILQEQRFPGPWHQGSTQYHHMLRD